MIAPADHDERPREELAGALRELERASSASLNLILVLGLREPAGLLEAINSARKVLVKHGGES